MIEFLENILIFVSGVVFGVITMYYYIKRKTEQAKDNVDQMIDNLGEY